VLICIGTFLVFNLESSATRDILPVVLETKKNDLNSKASFKSSDNLQDTSSFSTTIINADTTFTFVYKKSEKQKVSSVVSFFNLDKHDVSFSLYDKIEIGIRSEKAKRVALNLNIRGRRDSYKFIQKYIELTDEGDVYTLPLNEFITPASWYENNHATQTKISSEEETTIESISFEGCHLLPLGVQDEFTVFKVVLKRDLKLTYYGIVIAILLLIVGVWVFLYKPFNSESKIVYIPIADDVEGENEPVETRILTYLATNFTNADLTLNDLKLEFNISKAELSKLIVSYTKLSFPQYLAYLRVNEAISMLLKSPNKTIAEIGYAVGFNSPSNFIRVFKAQKGITPKKFLKGR